MLHVLFKSWAHKNILLVSIPVGHFIQLISPDEMIGTKNNVWTNTNKKQVVEKDIYSKNPGLSPMITSKLRQFVWEEFPNFEVQVSGIGATFQR